MWGDPKALRRLAVKAAAAQELPTWNKTVLDRSVKRALEKADGTRPVIAHSGVLPHPPQLDGTDSHLYFGWYHGDERDLPGFLRADAPHGPLRHASSAPRPCPPTPTFCEPERWPDLDWERLGRTHALQKAVFDRHVPPADHATFDELADRHAGVPGRRRPPAHRGAAPHQVPARPAGSPSSASPTATPRSPGRCSATTARPRPATTRCARPAGR